MRLLRHLTGQHRTTVTNRTLGLLLALRRADEMAGALLDVRA